MTDKIDVAADDDGLDALTRWADARSIRRLFWLSVAAFVAGEGLIGFLAILFKGFPGDRELGRTLLSAILCVTTALAGLALIRRRWLDGYAAVTVGAALTFFPVLVAFIWIPGGGDSWRNVHWSIVVFLGAVLAVSAQRLWLGEWRRVAVKRGVFIVTATSMCVIAPIAIAWIWGASSAGSKRALGAFSLLAFISFVMTPIVRRAFRGRTTVEEGSAEPVAD
jgi:hypothetical protein